MKTNSTGTHQAGFTLIELMVVVAVIAVLAAIAMPVYQGYVGTSRESVLVNNISSIEIENRLYAHPAVAAAAVVAKPDPTWGETPCAFVTLRDDATEVSEQEIIDFCRANMAHFKAPRKVVFGPLPKTSTGKIAVGATPEAAEALLGVIRETGGRIGFKAAGGIRSLEDAATYLEIAERHLGAFSDRIRNELFHLFDRGHIDHRSLLDTVVRAVAAAGGESRNRSIGGNRCRAELCRASESSISARG